jgi:hypothetical protein
MRQQYPLLLLLATTAALLTGCGSGLLPFLNPTPTPIPFVQFSAQDVFDALAAAGVTVESVESVAMPGRDDPAGFSERYAFQVPSIAPAGGQVIVFEQPADLAAWQAYIDGLRGNSATRRSVVYVYFNGNVMLQLNNALNLRDAEAFREAFEAMRPSS